MKQLTITITIALLIAGPLLFFITAYVNAQEPEFRFDHSLKLDMPVSLTFIQDRDGFLWIGTQNGLIRYDGYEQVIYRTGPNSVSGDLISSIIEDEDGILWIGSQGGGIDRYDKDTNQFTHYRHDPENPHSINNRWVYRILVDRVELNL
jgi:ligand-binding sensor domain-containing protein